MQIILTKKIGVGFVFLLISHFLLAQKMGQGKMGAQMNNGHFYGKIVDEKTNKGLAGITIQIKGNKFDSVNKKMKEVVLKTIITEANGDFDIEGLNLLGTFKFKATAVGYKAFENQISFDIKKPEGMPDAAQMQEMMSKADKDLGNIKMSQDSKTLANVEVATSIKQQFELGVDRKIFNVDKNIVSAGQTANELMKSIPSVSVDIDGNVSLRGAAPTIFIDGRPTTLTLDQIPVDIIDKVEIITNPSAKFDASGGNAGILNLVLKKNKKNGYNGNVRWGIDSRGRMNGGVDFSQRYNKLNFSLSASHNQRRSIGDNRSYTEFVQRKDSFVTTQENTTNDGSFTFLKFGTDYFLDNRNTFTINGNYNLGGYDVESFQTIDSSLSPIHPTNKRLTIVDFKMKNVGLQLSYKHLFKKTGHNLNADVNYNGNEITRVIDYTTTNSINNNFLQKTNGSGTNIFVTTQVDYENKINENTKLEAGLRTATRDFKTESLQSFNNMPSTGASVKYKFLDNVYAAYTTYSFKKNKTSYQLGLRLESSNYVGTMYNPFTNAAINNFKIDYPISLFPSVFITHKLSNTEDVQVNYSRRVNRPSFFQLLPNYDFLNPQNPTVGNPNLIPEFTNSFELSYNNAYKKNANFLVTAYYKHSTNLITNFLYKDYDRLTGKFNDSLYYSSYINANTSSSMGIEITNKIAINKWWDLMVNFNTYYSKINANIPNQSIDNSLVSWFGKMNNTFKFNKGWSFQINWDYRSKSIQPQGGGGGGMRGGGGMMAGGQGPQTLAQGFILPRYFDVDIALKKDWTWKNGQSGSMSLAMSDVFRARNFTEATSIYFFQTTNRFRDPQIVRFNFTYKFGKQDMSIFKRKNTKAEGGGMEGGM